MNVGKKVNGYWMDLEKRRQVQMLTRQENGIYICATAKPITNKEDDTRGRFFRVTSRTQQKKLRDLLDVPINKARAHNKADDDDLFDLSHPYFESLQRRELSLKCNSDSKIGAHQNIHTSGQNSSVSSNNDSGYQIDNSDLSSSCDRLTHTFSSVSNLAEDVVDDVETVTSSSGEKRDEVIETVVTQTTQINTQQHQPVVHRRLLSRSTTNQTSRSRPVSWQSDVFDSSSCCFSDYSNKRATPDIDCSCSQASDDTIELKRRYDKYTTMFVLTAKNSSNLFDTKLHPSDTEDRTGVRNHNQSDKGYNKSNQNEKIDKKTPNVVDDGTESTIEEVDSNNNHQEKDDHSLETTTPAKIKATEDTTVQTAKNNYEFASESRPALTEDNLIKHTRAQKKLSTYEKFLKSLAPYENKNSSNDPIITLERLETTVVSSETSRNSANGQNETKFKRFGGLFPMTPNEDVEIEVVRTESENVSNKKQGFSEDLPKKEPENFSKKKQGFPQDLRKESENFSNKEIYLPEEREAIPCESKFVDQNSKSTVKIKSKSANNVRIKSTQEAPRKPTKVHFRAKKLATEDVIKPAARRHDVESCSYDIAAGIESQATDLPLADNESLKDKQTFSGDIVSPHETYFENQETNEKTANGIDKERNTFAFILEEFSEKRYVEMKTVSQKYITHLPKHYPKATPKKTTLAKRNSIELSAEDVKRKKRDRIRTTKQRTTVYNTKGVVHDRFESRASVEDRSILDSSDDTRKITVRYFY